MKKKVAILISGRGSNMKSLIAACAPSDFPAQISVVISNNPDAPGLALAKESGVDTAVVLHKGRGKTDFENELIDVMNNYEIDLICLAGFMRVLSSHFFEHWRKPVLNIHPSLLRKHKGLNTHQAALDAKDRQHGCTVHFVTEDLDSGELILQREIPVKAGDTAETLAARVLEQEHIAYPEALRKIAARA